MEMDDVKGGHVSPDINSSPGKSDTCIHIHMKPLSHKKRPLLSGRVGLDGPLTYSLFHFLSFLILSLALSRKLRVLASSIDENSDREDRWMIKESERARKDHHHHHHHPLAIIIRNNNRTFE